MKPKSHYSTSLNDELAGFTRVDLIVTLLIFVVLTGMVSIGMGSYSGKAKRDACLENLKRIGKAMAIYANESDERLPYAGFRPQVGVHWSWDDLMNRQLGGHFSLNQLRSANPNVDMPVLRCPADRVRLPEKLEKAGGHRRSYAMPSHDMQGSNWPPGPSNRTGIGIVYNVETNKLFPSKIEFEKANDRSEGETNSPGRVNPKNTQSADSGDRESEKKNRNGGGKSSGSASKINPLPAFTIGMIPYPSKTIGITERIVGNNVIGSVTGSIITDINHHVQSKGVSATTYHGQGGTFGYLFIDGHVDSLIPVQTLDPKLPEEGVASGMWIVNQNSR